MNWNIILIFGREKSILKMEYIKLYCVPLEMVLFFFSIKILYTLNQVLLKPDIIFQSS